MLNEAQRNSLQIILSLIEEKMRAVTFRLAHPEEQALMFEVHNDLSPDTPQALQKKVAEASGLIQILRDRLALPREAKPTSRELLTGLAQLWVFLQESDSKGLRRFGDVHLDVSPALDAQIERLANLMLEMEDVILQHRRCQCVDAPAKRSESQT